MSNLITLTQLMDEMEVHRRHFHLQHLSIIGRFYLKQLFSSVRSQPYE